jgi:hypothetical protein
MCVDYFRQGTQDTVGVIRTSADTIATHYMKEPVQGALSKNGKARLSAERGGTGRVSNILPTVAVKAICSRGLQGSSRPTCAFVNATKARASWPWNTPAAHGQ